MGKLEFYRKCFKIAIESKQGRSAGLVVITLFLVAYFVAPLEGAMNILLWAIPLSVFIATLLLSPFSIYKDKEKDASGFKSRLDKIEESSPCIHLYKIENIKLPNFNNVGRVTSTRCYTEVSFANKPDIPTSKTIAQNVVGHLTFFDISRQNIILPETEGVWAHTPEITNGTLIPSVFNEANQKDLPPNGKPYPLSVLLKYHDTDECYGINPDTFLKYSPTSCNPNMRLQPGKYVVRIELRGVGVHEVFWFELINPSKGKEVKLTAISNHGNPMQ